METAKKSIILLDYINQITYVIPYDVPEGEDIEEHILNWSKRAKVNISLDNSNWMEFDELKLYIDPGTERGEHKGSDVSLISSNIRLYYI